MKIWHSIMGTLHTSYLKTCYACPCPKAKGSLYISNSIMLLLSIYGYHMEDT